MQPRILILILLTILITACGGDANLPKVTTPSISKYTQGDELISADQRIIMGENLQVAWWSLFANENLNQTIKNAMQQNYTVTAAKETLAQAQQSVKSLRGTLWPQVSLLADAGRQKYGVALFGPANFKIPPFTYYELGPQLEWTVDLFGQTRHAIKQQLALQQYQTHNLEAVYITLSSNVVAQALEIATLNAEIAATKNIIHEDQKILTLVEKAYAIGTHSQMDILNAKNQLENDKALLPPLVQRLKVAKHALAILVGKTPTEWNVPDFELENFALPKDLPVMVPSELVRKRPDILAAEDNLQAACAALGVANANFYPSLVLTANTLQEALTPGGLFKAASNAFAVAASLTMPLFKGGTLLAQQRQAEHAYKQIFAQYQQTVLTAFQEVADALTALVQDAELVRAEQLAFDAAKDSLLLANKGFMAGTLGLVKIQTDQRALMQAQINLIHAKTQRLLDTAQLFVVLGGTQFLD